MNIAFPAALIFLLILPGLIFRYAYARGSWYWNSPVSLQQMSNELAYSVLFAVGLHAIWLGISDSVGHPADIRALFVLLIANFGKDSQLLQGALNSVVDHTFEVFFYFISICFGAAVLGHVFHLVVRGLKLDRRTRILRFKNEWYYLLSGEVLSFEEVDDEGEEISGVYVAAVIEQGKTCYLYRGYLQDWSYDSEGELDLLRLRYAHRRALADDDSGGSIASTEEEGQPGAPDSRYYDIKGDYLLIRYADVKTLNLEYFSISDAPEPPQVEPTGLATVP